MRKFFIALFVDDDDDDENVDIVYVDADAEEDDVPVKGPLVKKHK